MRGSVFDRWAAKVDVSGGSDACWLWTGAKGRWGHGHMHVSGKGLKAYRLAWTFFRFPVPNNLCVLHRCDNGACCNPEHLFLGTQIDNIADRDAKGRTARGQQNGRCKLSADNVREIRALLACGMPQRKIAVRFGVHQTQITHIKSGYRHGHVGAAQ